MRRLEGVFGGTKRRITQATSVRDALYWIICNHRQSYRLTMEQAQDNSVKWITTAIVHPTPNRPHDAGSCDDLDSTQHKEESVSSTDLFRKLELLNNSSYEGTFAGCLEGNRIYLNSSNQQQEK